MLTNKGYSVSWMFLKSYYSSNIFQINSHVPMIYYEPYYIKINILSTPSKHEKLSIGYSCYGFC
jgi:hypothetical protein